MHGGESVGVLLDDRGLGGGEELAAHDASAGHGEDEGGVAVAVAQVGVGLVLQQRLHYLREKIILAGWGDCRGGWGGYEMMAGETSDVEGVVALLVEVLHVDAEAEQRPDFINQVLFGSGDERRSANLTH